jgi:hypothetical protein
VCIPDRVQNPAHRRFLTGSRGVQAAPGPTRDHAWVRRLARRCPCEPGAAFAVAATGIVRWRGVAAAATRSRDRRVGGIFKSPPTRPRFSFAVGPQADASRAEASRKEIVKYDFNSALTLRSVLDKLPATQQMIVDGSGNLTQSQLACDQADAHWLVMVKLDRRYAAKAACVRLVAPILRIMLRTWTLTVLSLIPRSNAMILLAFPSCNCSMTCPWRTVS